VSDGTQQSQVVRKVQNAANGGRLHSPASSASYRFTSVRMTETSPRANRTAGARPLGSRKATKPLACPPHSVAHVNSRESVLKATSPTARHPAHSLTLFFPEAHYCRLPGYLTSHPASLPRCHAIPPAAHSLLGANVAAPTPPVSRGPARTIRWSLAAKKIVVRQRPHVSNNWPGRTFEKS